MDKSDISVILDIMQVFYDLDSIPQMLQGAAVSIGKFDGMHLGHALIVHRLKSHAGRLRVPSIVLTFDPLPITILRPDLQVKPICTLQRKIELIRNFGVDALVVVSTDEEFLRQSAETFFFGTLQDRLRAKVLVEGKNFTFGRDRVGNAESIRFYGKWAGIDVDIVEPIQLGDEIVSSSGIRKLLHEGRIEHVNELMPMPFQLTGVVEQGDQRGRTLGFPTANLGRIETIVPKPGIYASLVRGEDRCVTATTHIGANPTFDIPTRKVEVYLHDFSGDLYGRKLHVDLFSYQREIVRFESKEDLVRQMEIDVRQSREITAPHLAVYRRST